MRTEKLREELEGIEEDVKTINIVLSKESNQEQDKEVIDSLSNFD